MKNFFYAFISYGRSDSKAFATKLNQKLTAQCLNVWFDQLDFNNHGGEFAANFNELVRTLDTDRDHVRNHSKWSQRALEWQKISVSTNYIYDCPECAGGSINQIIVGIAGENSTQACIYNGCIRGSGSNKFTLTALKELGTYYIRFRYAQAYGCEQGALGWLRINNGPTAEANIGAIVVKGQGGQAKQ